MDNTLPANSRNYEAAPEQFSLPEIAGMAFVLFCIHLTSSYRYLLFHNLVELFSIFVAATIFVIAINSWRLINNQYLIFIGTSYAFIALLDTFHTLSFVGMEIFKDYDYYAPQFWIASRGLEAVSMLVAFAFLGSRFRLNIAYLIAAFTAVTAFLIASILTLKIFPICFIPGKGLTPFKIYSEYVIIGLFLTSLVMLYSKRGMFNAGVFRLLVASLIAMAIMEFCFTLYYSNSMSDTANELGHLFKIIAFYLIYKAIVVTGIRDPINLLFHDLKEKEDQLIESEKKATFYDSLTGLPNRRLFLDRLGHEIRKAHHDGASLCLLHIDINRFREINETLGHDKGDRLLVEISRRIHGVMRESDTLARSGGDEFMLIIPNCTEAGTVDGTTQLILKALAEPFNLGTGELVRTSGSIGIVRYPEDAETVDELLRHADQALDSAKAGGGNGFSYFSVSMQQKVLEKVRLTNDLRYALGKGQLEIYYQPIVEAGSGRIDKAEALLRWHHPMLGMVSPAVFIPLAEESGMILEIGEWIFVSVIENIKRWQDKTGRLLQISVNKSPVQFKQDKHEAWLDLLKAYNLPGSVITIEITEGMLLTDSDATKNVLLEYQRQGVEVSIDDFGTGFSALSYLARFDIDFLKLDRSFVSDIVSNKTNQSLVEGIILMAHKLGIQTVAEGVEMKEQRDLLLSMGCDYIQGFLYSPAVTASAFEALLMKQPHQ